MDAKILIIDIETRPILAYVWGIWKQNVGLNQIKEDLGILTYSAKWLGDDSVYWDSIQHDLDERRLLEGLWELLDEADIIVAHNGDRFDVPLINGFFMKYDMKPYSPIKKVDTLKVIKNKFRLTSNKLDYLSKYLGFEGKIATGGMQLWIDCLHGINSAWEKMVEYNVADVIVLEDAYKKLLPWISNHPNVSIYSDDTATCCAKCGSSNVQYRGFAHTQAGRYQRFRCNDCGGWGRLASNVLPKNKRKGLSRNVAD